MGQGFNHAIDTIGGAVKSGVKKATPYVRNAVDTAATAATKYGAIMKPGAGLARDVSKDPLFRKSMAQVTNFGKFAEIAKGGARDADAIAIARQALEDGSVLKTISQGAESSHGKVARTAAKRMRGATASSLSDKDIVKALDWAGSDPRVATSLEKFQTMRALSGAGTENKAFLGVVDNDVLAGAGIPNEVERMARDLSADPRSVKSTRKILKSSGLDSISTKYLMDPEDRASKVLTRPVKGYFGAADVPVPDRVTDPAGFRKARDTQRMTSRVRTGTALGVGAVGIAGVNRALTRDDY